MADEQTIGTIELATDLTIAWLSNAHTRASADEVDAFLSVIHAKLGSLVQSSETEETHEPDAGHVPAVSVRKSLASPDFIVSMIDGKPYRTLKRHLSTNGLTPAEYRQRYNLKADYPMVAPAYSEARRATAKRLGLGRKKGEPGPVKKQGTAPAERPAVAPKPRSRKSVADAKAAAQEHLKS